MSDKKLAGLWIDGRKAIVVTNHDGQDVSEFEVKQIVFADVQHGNSNENAANNVEQTNKSKFFKEIEKVITNSTDLYITGPGTSQEELRNHLLETPQYKNLKIKLGTDSQLSEEQVLEEVKSHFHA
ncbi:hypothetical protein [Epilithonimonas hominis]|uniref:Protein required for attachment to host cells n=1 Tax=Epilithonimonas hominis TaxID=420404 RepID=A0A1H6K3N9_9FLAO|nr:hypothetical protein [Epilithonimonas hominis]SEH66958.1 hypothetical protein SAMN05421793_11911 [Epilithonimonas hominis]